MVPLKGLLAARWGVGVDPLVIVGGVGQQVHLLLRDVHPVGCPHPLADQIESDPPVCRERLSLPTFHDATIISPARHEYSLMLRPGAMFMM